MVILIKENSQAYGIDMSKKNAFLLSLTSDIGFKVAQNLKQKGWNIYGTYRVFDRKLLDVTHKQNLIQIDFSRNLSSFKKIQLIKFLKKTAKISLFSCFSGNQKPIGLLDRIDFREWYSSFNINLMVPINIFKISIPFLVKNSSIIFFTGGGPNKATKFFSAYSLSKFTLIKFIEQMSLEYKKFNFACVNPGWVNTKAHRHLLKAKGLKNSKDLKKLKLKIKYNDWVSYRKTIDFFDWYTNLKNKKLSGRYFVLDYDKIFEKEYIYRISKNENNLKMRRKEINEGN